MKLLNNKKRKEGEEKGYRKQKMNKGKRQNSPEG